MLRGILVAACALSLLLGASAQVNPQPAVTVALAASSASVPAGNATTLEATVTNPGSVSGAVTVEPTAPEGWSVEADPAAFPLDAGATQTVTLTLTAPAAGAGAATGSASIAATLTDQLGRTATGEGSLSLTRVDPAPPPPPPPGPNWLLIGALASLGVALVAGATAWFVLKRRREAREAAALAAAEAAYLDRETGITIRVASGPFPLGLKREATWKVEVENTSDRPRVAIVEVAERPEGWVVSVNTPRVPLDPGQRSSVTVYTRPDESVAYGALGKAVLLTKPAEAQERDERVTLELVAEEPRIASTGGDAPTPFRNGAPGAPRPLLRR